MSCYKISRDRLTGLFILNPNNKLGRDSSACAFLLLSPATQVNSSIPSRQVPALVKMNVPGPCNDNQLETGVKPSIGNRRFVYLWLLDSSRGPAGSRNNQPVVYRNNKPMKQFNYAAIAESLVSDINKTEYHVFVYNKVKVGELSVRSEGPPQWTGAGSNPFFPKDTEEFNEMNNFHAAIAYDHQAEEQPNLSLTVGHGGRKSDWEEGKPFYGLKPFEDVEKEISGPSNSAICINIKFELEDASANEIDETIGKPPLADCISPVYRPDTDKWLDTVRLEIAQKGFPNYLSFNIRFVESQGEHLLDPVPIQAQLFNISSITLSDVATKETPFGEFDTVTCVVKLAFPLKKENDEAEGDAIMKQ
ncbi:uncharacterized protein NECHADRAFT_74763 [Fusarium vanettenii 77-13-4]|uniref:Uncharacterized protein n=1 Tax=Fusarium vanettenii (strain ATCC MYA-4622 / CBS 123669 / FGSC 9596 / NRRL 45880 / 77-13-4) TaxID=660122 RepID=C7YGW4_FUSV7|nr:uncharacterized protein NECHADRAFT_74763 [Fusarium vanettenii 77-13-4]EEU47814.1 hypothetical protein NECHADRAFT_74763 [Fusarium vanettenii 77-13-4]